MGVLLVEGMPRRHEIRRPVRHKERSTPSDRSHSIEVMKRLLMAREEQVDEASNSSTPNDIPKNTLEDIDSSTEPY